MGHRQRQISDLEIHDMRDNSTFLPPRDRRPASLPAYVSAVHFARASGISLRAAQKALKRAAAGKLWNGLTLDVRAIHSRGGAAGLCYEVAVSSLPPDLAAKLAPAAPPAIPRLTSGPSWRLDLIKAIQDAGPPGSEARAAQLRAVAACATYPAGKRMGQPVAERTIRAWVASAEAGGFLKVAGATRRADRGTSRVLAWREWDRAMRDAGVSDARQREIAARLDADVRGLWAGGEVSAANIQFSMTVRCRALAEEAGLRLPEAEMAKLCRMPLHYAGEKSRRRARMAHIKRTDAARWAADHVPRVRRHRDGLRPMDLVAVDMRHSDRHSQTGSYSGIPSAKALLGLFRRRSKPHLPRSRGSYLPEVVGQGHQCRRHAPALLVANPARLISFRSRPAGRVRFAQEFQ